VTVATDDLRVPPLAKVDLARISPDDRLGWRDRAAASAAADAGGVRLAELATMLAANRTHALLLVLQGVDASGKDGAVRHVFSAVNPSTLRVTAFKVPTSTELAHDFLWRAHAATPARGEIGIWNRSHYEDVLVPRVDRLVPKTVWRRRYTAINAFEEHLVHEGTIVVKCFLHVSLAEQARRLDERLADPRKNWKFSPADLEKREQWPEYREAYEALLSKTSTRLAPWHVIPADHTSVRNAAITALLVETLEALNMTWPAAAR
jgi:PPK2 family polyphosphate:nucleotide phosphotransferase